MAEQISILHMEVNFQFVEMNHGSIPLEGFRLRGLFVLRPRSGKCALREIQRRFHLMRRDECGRLRKKLLILPFCDMIQINRDL